MSLTKTANQSQFCSIPDGIKMYYLSVTFEQFIPKYNSLKNNIYYFTVSVSRKVGSSIAGFWLRISHEVTLRLLAAAGASEGKTGAGGYTSKMTYSHGCWQNTSPPGTLDVLK